MMSSSLPVEIPMIRCTEKAELENKMEDDGDFIVLKNAILLNRREVAAREWRNFILENWQKLTEHLENATIMLIAGRHGKASGDIGPYQDSLLWTHEQQVKIMEKNLKEDLEERKLKFVILDVDEMYNQDNELNNKVLKARILKINPSLIVISICFSEILDLRFVLEMEAIFPNARLERDLTMVTKGQQIHLDPAQRELLFTLSDPLQVDKCVIVTGPEGSGKSILAVEATKIKFSHYLKKYGLKANEGKGKIRILICGAYQGNDRVSVLLQALQEQLKECQEFCTLQTRSTTLNVTSFEDFLSKVQDEILVQTSDDEEYLHSIVLLDELLPQFCLEEWTTGLSFENTDFVIAFRHSFCNTRYARCCAEMRSDDAVEIKEDKVICQLKKRFRCSNEITSLIFYLLVHSPKVHHPEYKSFVHSLDSFDSGKNPAWLELENVEHFIEFTNTDQDFIALEKDVMVIYDPNDGPFSLQPLKTHCKARNWQCYPYTDIVGSEADTVIIYDLKDFHFEAFSRAINHLVIVTIQKDVWTSTLKKWKKGRLSVPNLFAPSQESSLSKELRKIKLGKHDESICKMNCERNMEVFGYVEPYHCTYKSIKGWCASLNELLEIVSMTATPNQADKIWSSETQKPVAYFDFFNARLEEVQRDVTDGRRPSSDLEALQQAIDGINCSSVHVSVHVAAKNGRVDLLMNLVPKLNERNPKDDDGITPLHLAATHGHLDAVKYLWSNIIDMHPKAGPKFHQQTPLHSAAIGGHFEVVKFLVESIEGNINPSLSNGQTVLHLAAAYGHLEIVSFYTSQFYINPGQCSEDEFEGKTPLHYAAQEGKLSVVRHFCSLLSKNPNPMDANGDTPLHLAARFGHYKVVTFYTEKLKIVNPAKESTSFRGRTPLHNAAQKGHNRIVQYFCQFCLNLDDKNPPDEYGYTPLHLAAENGHFGAVKIIADCLEDKHPKSYTKVTPANLAKEAGHFHIANFLWHGSDGLDLENDLTVRKRSTRKPRSRYQSPLKMISGIFRTKSLTPQKARKTKKATFKRYSDSAAGSFDFD